MSLSSSLSLSANISFYLPSAVLCISAFFLFFFWISSLQFVAGQVIGPENLEPDACQMHYGCYQMTLSLLSVQEENWVKWDISNTDGAISQLSAVYCVSLSYLLMWMKVERSGVTHQRGHTGSSDVVMTQRPELQSGCNHIPHSFCSHLSTCQFADHTVTVSMPCSSMQRW